MYCQVPTVRCLLSGVYILLGVYCLVCCVLSGVYCQVSTVRCLLSGVYCQVLAVLASLMSISPSATSAIFSSVYNCTAELGYPWQATYYLTSIGFTLLGRPHQDTTIYTMYFVFLRISNYFVRLLLTGLQTN